MAPLILALALAAEPIRIALLPVDARALSTDDVRAAERALAAALTPPFVARDLDAAALRVRLAAQGPACADDAACLCAVAELAPGQAALRLRIEPVGSPTREGTAATWGMDLALIVPCDGRSLGRTASIVPADGAELARAVREAATELLAAGPLIAPPRRGASAAPR